MSRQIKLVVGLALIPAIICSALILLRICGLARTFYVPTGGMAPAVSAGDHVMTEGFSFLFREPRRGDIAIFKTDRIAPLPPSQIFTQRIVGEPGDRVQLLEGKLFINEKQVPLCNAGGEIVYNLPRGASSYSLKNDMIVPADCYLLLGDNSTNSYDSRYWGIVPRTNIIGCVSFCYWPPTKMGSVK